MLLQVELENSIKRQLELLGHKFNWGDNEVHDAIAAFVQPFVEPLIELHPNGVQAICVVDKLADYLVEHIVKPRAYVNKNKKYVSVNHPNGSKAIGIRMGDSMNTVLKPILKKKDIKTIIDSTTSG
jgi:hypothetical protein